MIGYRVFRSAESQILPFPIDFDGCPYNTLTLPCERVIFTLLLQLQYRNIQGAGVTTSLTMR